MLIVPSAYGNSQLYQCPTRSNFVPIRRQLDRTLVDNRLLPQSRSIFNVYSVDFTVILINSPSNFVTINLQQDKFATSWSSSLNAGRTSQFLRSRSAKMGLT